MNRLAFQSRNENMENASSEANNAARHLSLDDFRVFAAQLDSLIIATQDAVKAAQICNSDEMRLQKAKENHVLFTLSDRTGSQITSGIEFWGVAALLIARPRKLKKCPLLLIENDVHTKITINQIRCSLFGRWVFLAERGKIVWLMVSTVRHKSYDSLLSRSSWVRRVLIYVWNQMPSNGYWL